VIKRHVKFEVTVAITADNNRAFREAVKEAKACLTHVSTSCFDYDIRPLRSSVRRIKEPAP
jgi:hypothetical protein